MTRAPDPLDHLADSLSEDIVAAPAEQLVAEAAEDACDAGAFASAFDRVAARATRQARRRRLAERVRDVVSGVVPRRSWRSALAVTAGLAVIVVAGDLYLHVQPQLVSAPDLAARAPVRVQDEMAPDRLQPERRIEAPPVVLATPAAPPASQPSAAAVSPPAPNQSAGSAGSRGHLTMAPAPARPQAAASEDRLRTLLKGEQARDGEQARANTEPDKAAKRQAPTAAPLLLGRQVAPSFIWPLRGRVIAHFGPGQGAARSDGVDIAAPVGSDVHAAADGVVVYAGDDIKGFGNLVLVRHRDDVVTAYAYANALLVKRDDTVRRGQVIAKSGSGGPGAVPMLHFEMRKGATPVDPAQYLPPQ